MSPAEQIIAQLRAQGQPVTPMADNPLAALVEVLQGTRAQGAGALPSQLGPNFFAEKALQNLAIPAVNDLGNALTLPGRALRGEVGGPQYNPDTGELSMIGDDLISGALEAALTWGGPAAAGGTATAAARGVDPNQLNIFASAKRAGKNPEELLPLEDLVEVLSNPTGWAAEDTWYNHGLFLGADGNWRVEVPDFASRGAAMHDYDQSMFNVYEALGGPGDTIDLEKIFSYMNSTAPKSQGPLADIMSHDRLFELYPELGKVPTTARFSTSQGGVYTPGDDAPTINARGPSNTDIMSVLLHEAQHGVQALDGHASGGNPQWAGHALKKFAPTADQQLQYPHPHQIYEALMGEVEARNVQHRFELGTAMNDPITAPPWTTQELPYELQFNPRDLAKTINSGNPTAMEEYRERLKALSAALTGKLGPTLAWN